MKNLTLFLPALSLLVMSSIAAPAHARTHAEVLAGYLTALPNGAGVEPHRESGWAPRTRAEVLADYDKALPATPPNQGNASVQLSHDRTPSQMLVDLDKA